MFINYSINRPIWDKRGRKSIEHQNFQRLEVPDDVDTHYMIQHVRTQHPGWSLSGFAPTFERTPDVIGPLLLQPEHNE